MVRLPEGYCIDTTEVSLSMGLTSQEKLPLGSKLIAKPAAQLSVTFNSRQSVISIIAIRLPRSSSSLVLLVEA
jgi:hypothetical protein